MWDLATLKYINRARPVDNYLHIFAIGNDKFALGNRGSKAAYVVRRVLRTTDRRGRALYTYKGVQARKPRIMDTAPLISREKAPRALLSALGLRSRRAS